MVYQYFLDLVRQTQESNPERTRMKLFCAAFLIFLFSPIYSGANSCNTLCGVTWFSVYRPLYPVI
jgi:hypothetical protein